jgi:CRISPR/Cas system-associated exonuclease Cas4 (RecB family)
MASKNFSVSRIKCFNACPLQYKYKFVDGWKTSATKKSDDIQKGLALHETFEHFPETLEDAMALLHKNLEKYPVNHELYPLEVLEMGVKRYYHFWNNFVKPLLDDGYKATKETWMRGTISGQPFIGALDLLLKKGDDTIIIDYKTASSVSASSYKEQLLVYTYLNNNDLSVAAEKTKLYVFFPLGKLKTGDEYGSDVKSSLSCLKEIKFEKADLVTIVDKFQSSIEAITAKDWNAIDTKDATIHFGCKWCDYNGSVENENGFKGCPLSYDVGGRQSRGTSFFKEV